ncbi:MAG TPA: nuclear transport factor 2 family protein [Candidatus Cybelea sp.]|jgi:ketosteroid isomerase-like protein
MKYLICCVVIFATLSATTSDPQIATQITGLNALLQTATERYDADTISNLITKDYTLVDEKGQVWDRATFLKVVGNRSHTWIANDPSDVTVKSYNGDCAVLTGLLHIKFSMDGKIHDLTDRFTDVWVKDGENWRYVQGQATVYKPS